MDKNVLKIFADAIQKQEGWYKGSHSYRNNNPGNIMDPFVWNKVRKEWRRIWPHIPIDSDNFLIFPNYEAGRKELEHQITIKANRGETVEGIIYHWAPPSGTPIGGKLVLNDTDTYIKAVSDALGVDPGAVVKDIKV